MRKPKLNQKQLKLERERQLAEKKIEFATEFHEQQRELKELGWDDIFPPDSVENFVERKCKAWEATQLNVPSGKYADWSKTVSEYQQKFIYFLSELCPHIFDELRQFVFLFDELFGKDKEKYNAIFNSYNVDILNLDSSLSSEIRYRIVKDYLLEFKSYNHNNYDFDFRWGEFKLLFCLLVFKFAPPEDSSDRKELFDEIFNLIKKDLILRTDLIKEKIDPEILQLYIDKNCLSIIESLLFSDNCKYFFERADDSLTRYLTHLFTGNQHVDPADEFQPYIKTFIKLQYQLIEWASRHNLGKDWILRYAYYFLSKFSENPNINISEIEIRSLSSRSLAAYPFEFKFNGWLAGDEKREDYEQRLRDSFENEVVKYFHEIHNFFQLDQKKRLTKPKNYDRVKWLVMWTVQGLSKEQILREIEKETRFNHEIGNEYEIRTLDKAFHQFKKYALPVRT